MEVVNLNLTDLFSEFEPSLEFLLHVSGEKASQRFDVVRANLADIVKYYDPKTNQVLRDGTGKELFMSAHEALDLIEVVRYFKTQDPSSLPIDNIRRILRGPAYHTDETSENNGRDPRNIQFEFYLASKIGSRGNKILEYNDVVAEIGSFTFDIQCKRPPFRNRISSGFHKAVQQLRKKNLVQKNRYGVIAISLDKAFGTDNVLIPGSNTDEAFARLRVLKEAAVKILGPALDFEVKERIIGVLFLGRTFMWDKTGGRFMPMNALFTHRTNQKMKVDEYDLVLEELRLKGLNPKQ